MWLVNFFTSSVAGDIIFKLFIAFLLSIIIGIERELFHKPAGVKTHLLICMSSTLIMSLSLYMYNLYGASMDPARLPAQIIAGIGFVGAGTIIREGFNVRGITTAASLLAITCIGLAVGAGFYYYSEHSKRNGSDKRTKDKRQKGNARRQRDQGGEKKKQKSGWKSQR